LAPIEFEFHSPKSDEITARFKIDLFFGSTKAYIYDRKIGATLVLDVNAVLSEENYREEFATLVQALHKSGRMQEGDRADCVTYPEGSTMVFSQGNA